MRVLTVMFDVSSMTDKEIEDLQVSLEVQGEDTDAIILNSGVKTIEIPEE